MSFVAHKKQGCLVCEQGKEIFEEVNEAIWDGREPVDINRVRGGCIRAGEVMTTYNHPVDIRTIYRHRQHIERSHRKLTFGSPPQTTRELALYATDFESVTDRMANIGMQAAGQLERRMLAGELEDKALVGVAQMGLRAATSRESAARADRQPQVQIMAIFGVAGGYLSTQDSPRLIESQVREIDLTAQIEDERLHLEELQQQ